MTEHKSCDKIALRLVSKTLKIYELSAEGGDTERGEFLNNHDGTTRKLDLSRKSNSAEYAVKIPPPRHIIYDVRWRSGAASSRHDKRTTPILQLLAG